MGSTGFVGERDGGRGRATLAPFSPRKVGKKENGQNKFSFGIFQRNQQYYRWREKQRHEMLWDFEEQILDNEKLSVTASVGFLGVKMKVLTGSRGWLS